MSSASDELNDAAASFYQPVGPVPFYFARGKLRHDPVFLAVLKSGLIKNGMTVLDLGCGQGLLFALLRAAESQYQRGTWPDDWPAPPLGLDLHGIELRESEVSIAHKALKSLATITPLDLSHGDLPHADVVVLFDVLHYLNAEAQGQLIKRIARTISPGGLLLVRDADATAGFSYSVTYLAERIAAICRGHFRQRFHFRSLMQWKVLFTERGFAIETMPMSEGTPFANVLWVARQFH
ncbi:MAG: class I SAM-dependent methyltransferase [Burkholderiales bacterium]